MRCVAGALVALLTMSDGAAADPRAPAEDAARRTPLIDASEAAPARVEQSLTELCWPTQAAGVTVSSLAPAAGARSVPSPVRETFREFVSPPTAWVWEDAPHVLTTEEWITPNGLRGCRIYVFGGDVDAVMARISAVMARRGLVESAASHAPGTRAYKPAAGKFPSAFVTRAAGSPSAGVVLTVWTGSD